MSSILRTRFILCTLGLAAGGLCGWNATATTDAEPPALEERFAARVQPLLQRYCYSCHGAKKPKAALDLSRDATVPAIVKNLKQWETVLERVHAGEMPPEEARLQPQAEERAALVAWIRDLRDREARRTAGDPGVVLARRLFSPPFSIWRKRPRDAVLLQRCGTAALSHGTRFATEVSLVIGVPPIGALLALKFLNNRLLVSDGFFQDRHEKRQVEAARLGVNILKNPGTCYRSRPSDEATSRQVAYSLDSRNTLIPPD
jgi:hypothetical protein